MEVTTGAQNEINGASNTAIIANLSGTYSAADYCANLVEEGYDNWYLPAKDELRAAYEESDLNSFFSNDNNYWSSTEDPEGSNWFAWYLSGYDGMVTTNGKNDTLTVRCLR
jgi:hypothetical protein